MAIFASAWLGCTNSERDSAEEAADVVVSTGSALSVNDVASVSVTITGSGITTPIVKTLTRNGASTWQATIGAIPVGADRVFIADAYDSSQARIFSGQVSPVTIAKGATAQVAILLQQTTPSPAHQDAAPQIDSLSASTLDAAPGELVTFSGTGHDPDGEPVTFSWATSAGTGTSTTNVLPWTAPSTEGPARIEFRVTSPSTGVTTSTTFSVNVAASNARGSATVVARFNLWPVVTTIQGALRLDVGASSDFLVVASDADGDALGYAWGTTCPGTFPLGTAAASTRFALGANPPVTCALYVDVTDGRGGSTRATLTLGTGVGPLNIGPQVDSTSQSALAVDGATTMSFDVVAHDPEGGPLTYQWFYGAGNELAGAATNEFVWRSPNCFPTDDGVTVQAMITDDHGLTTVASFVVAPVPGAVCADTVDTSTSAAWIGQTGFGALGVLPDGRSVVWPRANYAYFPPPGVAHYFSTTGTRTLVTNNYAAGTPAGSFAGTTFIGFEKPTGVNFMSGFRDYHFFDTSGNGLGMYGFGIEWIQAFAYDRVHDVVWAANQFGGGAVGVSASSPFASYGGFNVGQNESNFLSASGDRLYLSSLGGWVSRANTTTKTVDWTTTVHAGFMLRQGALDTTDAFIVTSEAGDNGVLAKVDAAGAIQFVHSIGATTVPVVDAADNIYVGASVAGVSTIRSYDSAGGLRWSVQVPTPVSQILIGDRGLVYAMLAGAIPIRAGADNNDAIAAGVPYWVSGSTGPASVTVLHTANGTPRRTYSNLAGRGQILLAPGRLFVKTAGSLYALGSVSTQGYEVGAPWPSPQHDNLMQASR